LRSNHFSQGILAQGTAERDGNGPPLARLESEPTGDRIGDLELANGQAGFEALAFYISFHNPTTDGRWGVFYWDGAIRALAAKINRDLRISDPEKCARMAIEILLPSSMFRELGARSPGESQSKTR
jgi:hypothetical protein